MNRLFSYLRDRYALLSKIVLFALSVFVLVLILPREGKFKFEFSKGKPWMHQNLIAPFDFAILKTKEELEAEKSQLIKNLSPYFIEDTLGIIKQRDILINNFEREWKVIYKDLPDQYREKTEESECLCCFVRFHYEARNY